MCSYQVANAQIPTGIPKCHILLVNHYFILMSKHLGISSDFNAAFTHFQVKCNTHSSAMLYCLQQENRTLSYFFPQCGIAAMQRATQGPDLNKKKVCFSLLQGEIREG